MHERAETGIAAHYLYKDKADADANIDLPWLTRIIDWEKETSDPTQFMEDLKVDLEDEEAGEKLSQTWVQNYLSTAFTAKAQTVAGRGVRAMTFLYSAAGWFRFHASASPSKQRLSFKMPKNRERVVFTSYSFSPLRSLSKETNAQKKADPINRPASR